MPSPNRPSHLSSRRSALGLGLGLGLATLGSSIVPLQGATASSRIGGPGPQPLSLLDTRTGGRLEVVESFASAHAAPRKLVLWLPPGYDKRLPHAVLYMHDGQNLFDPGAANGGVSWDVDLRLAALIAQRAVRPTLVAGIWNTPLRWREYVPAPALQRLSPELQALVHGLAVGDLPAAQGGPLSDGYLRFIVEELKPWVDARYRTLPGRDDTFIMGSSMGGLISLQALLRHPDVFGGAGCVSTHWPVTTNRPLLQRVGAGDAGAQAHVTAIGQAWLDEVAARLPPPGRHRLYMDHGTLNLDALYAPFQQRMDAIVARAGWKAGSQVMSRVFPGADHNEASWSERVAIPLRFLLAPSGAARG